MKAGIERLGLPDAMRVLDTKLMVPDFRKDGIEAGDAGPRAGVFGQARTFLLIRPRGFEYMAETVAALRDHWDALEDDHA